MNNNRFLKLAIIGGGFIYLLSGVISFIFMVLMGVGTIGRIPANDWDKYRFDNNYILERYSSRNIRFSRYYKDEKRIEQVTNGYITEFTESSKYIVLKELNYKIIDNLNDKELEKFLSDYPNNVQKDEIQYYIIDLINNKVIGPLSEVEYNDYITTKGIVINEVFCKTKMD